MSRSFMEHRNYITVAVGFDAQTMPLTEIAVGLCQATGKKLCLLHVVEPWAEKPHSKAFGEEDQFWNVTQAVESNARELAMSKLNEISMRISPEVSVKKVVAGGKAVETICREVEEIGTCLLLVGGNYGNTRFLPKGLSTALSLMVSAPVPLLVVDTHREKALTTKNLKFLIGDDLSEKSETAVEFTFDLATALGGCAVKHVHVNGLTFDSLKAGLNTAAATSHTPLNTSTSVENVFSALITGIEEKMTARTTDLQDYLEASKGSYSAEVVTGSVAEEIDRAAEAFGADIIVFGRHQTWHKKPFFIGRVPFKSMLAQKKPVIIVPNT